LDKRLKYFLTLTGVIVFGCVGILVALIFFYVYISKYILSYLAIALVVLLFLLLVSASVASVFSIMLYKKIKMNRSVLIFARTMVKNLVRFICYIGWLAHMDTNDIRAFYIHINNSLLKTHPKKYLAKDILVLLPHCIQNSDCSFRVTVNPSNCMKCGKCSIGSVLEATKNRGVETYILTGGTAARQKILSKKPKIVLAVACEMDLFRGIMDISKIPVIGFINIRPNGPCYNTDLDVNDLITTLDSLIKKV